MTLELPADAEVFLPEGEDFDALHGSGVYALRLERPDDLPAVWDRTFDERPAYWDDLVSCAAVVYVGAAKDVLARLTEHNDGKIKKARVVQVCEIDSIRNIWWFDDDGRAFERESGLAITLQNEYPEWFVWSN